jgi:hypothetical protein
VRNINTYNVSIILKKKNSLKHQFPVPSQQPSLVPWDRDVTGNHMNPVFSCPIELFRLIIKIELPALSLFPSENVEARALRATEK